jgi:hypothetical protein
MAIPPEPLEELLAQATDVVDAEVARVLETGPAPEQPNAPREGATSVGYKTPMQVVELKIARTLKGNAKGTVTVQKPVAAYALRPGNKGPFFLQAGSPNPLILGRYGPDTHRMHLVEAALKPKK